MIYVCFATYALIFRGQTERCANTFFNYLIPQEDMREKNILFLYIRIFIYIFDCYIRYRINNRSNIFENLQNSYQKILTREKT